MMCSVSPAPQIINYELKVLQDNKEKLVSILKEVDLVKLSVELFRPGVISKDVKDKFDSLDHDRLDSRLRVRYLLQHVYEKIKLDARVYDTLIKVLAECGSNLKQVCVRLNEELDDVKKEAGLSHGTSPDGQASNVMDFECGASGGVSSSETVVGAKQNIFLSEEHIPILCELLVEVTHKWEVMGILLGLSMHVLQECRIKAMHNNKACLYNVLYEWISGKYKHARPATLDMLRYTLASIHVGSNVIAQNLEERFKKSMKVSSVLVAKRPYSESTLVVLNQSCDTEVAEGKSTLLEVQVSPNESVSYQWIKDGQFICDDVAYSGACTDTLFINVANQEAEGRYACHISNGNEVVASDTIILTVSYPPEKKRLVDIYSHSTRIPKDTWPPVSSSTYINLALVKKNNLDNDDGFNYTVQGDMDDILMCKEMVQYMEVFGEYKRGALMLVEGRPGSGKTTLVHEVARDWAIKGNVLKSANVVFLIPLNISYFSTRGQCLSDILGLLYYSDHEIAKMVSSIVESDGKGVCFILDGLDQYNPKDDSGTVITSLLHKTYLPLSMVIVVSRPVATAAIRHLANIRVEVLGFAKQDIKRYIEMFPFQPFQDTFGTNKLVAYLAVHSNILQMCYLPIHAAMICFLYGQLGGDMPVTETQIYEKFTLFTLLRKLARHNKFARLCSLHDLLGEEKEVFDVLCKLAFYMTINAKKVICQSDTEVPLSSSTGSDVSSLGLVTIDCKFAMYGVETMCTFHHLTFQEYLAAFHIARLNEEEQMKVIMLYGGKGYMGMVWKFYCGIVNFEGKMSQLEEVMKSTRTDSLYGVHCAFESQQGAVCDYIVQLEEPGVLSFNYHTFTPSDFTAMRYVISTSSHPVTGLVFDGCELEEEGTKLFLMEGKLKLVRSLSFHSRSMTLEKFHVLNILLKNFPLLEVLNLLETELDKNAVEVLTENVTLPNLQVLKIHIPIGACSKPEEVLQLLRFGSASIKQVDFSHHTCSSTDALRWRLLVSHAFHV